MSIDDQNNHPLYKQAHDRFLRAEAEQNAKAAAKYPEPLNPASWTAEELGDHYAQESVDQGRYVEALVAKCAETQRKLDRANNALLSSKETFSILSDPKENIGDEKLRKALRFAISCIDEILEDTGGIYL